MCAGGSEHGGHRDAGRGGGRSPVNGTMAVRNVLALLDGKAADRIDSVPLVLVTKNNLDQAPQYCP